MDFSQRVSKSCCHPVAVMILVMYVDNSGIRHSCEELGSEFERFVVMAMNPGANLDSLPIFDNPDNFVMHAYAAFILELSYVATNDLPQLNSFKTYSTRSFSKQRLFISRMPDFWFHYLLGITDRKSSWCCSIVFSHLLTSMQSASPLCHLLSISARFLTRITGAARLPTISLSTVLRFSQACDSFQDGGAKGAHGVGWMFLCVRVGLLACRKT